MYTINLLWSSELIETNQLFYKTNKVFYPPQTLAYDIIQGGIKIDLVCCAMNSNSIKTAISVQQYFDKHNKNKNKVYVVPFISDDTYIPDDHDNDNDHIIILKQKPELPDYYELPNHIKTFEKHILPFIKDLICKDKKYSFYILMIAPKKTIDDYFNVELQPGQFICQTYQYRNIHDKAYDHYVKQYIPYFKTHIRMMKTLPLSKRLFLM